MTNKVTRHGAAVVATRMGCWAAFAMIALLPSMPVSAVDYVPGIDVSRWQGDINWTSVKNAGVGFAFTKATEGVDFIDIRFLQNMNAASAAGVPIGPYHFARPDSFANDPLDAVKEANDFVDAIEPFYQSGGNFLRPVLDVERLPGKGSIAADRAYLSQWIRDFIGVVDSRLGLQPLIYSNASYANTYYEPDLAQYDLWLARWTHNVDVPPTRSNTGIWSDWTVWQWTDSWTVTGIAGAVDGDVFQGTVEQMQQVLGVGVSGDYNANGIVDAADYTTWRDNLGAAAGALPNDVDGGVIGPAQYATWKANFDGSSQASAALQNSAVPEPSTGRILLFSVAAILLVRRTT